MAKNNNLTDFTTDLSNAIRNKCKITGTIDPQDFSDFVGGMPFYKYYETRDITSPSSVGVGIPLSYGTSYIKGEVYLTNDNGLTEIPADNGTGMVIVSGTGEVVGSLNNTSDRLTISGVWNLLDTGYIAFIAGIGDGEELISAGWHMKVDIFDLNIGNPNGKSTHMILNTATGEGTI